MRRRPASEADVAGALGGLIKGADGNRADMQKFGLRVDDVKNLLDRFNKQNALQEKAKADLQQATRDLNAIRKDSLKEFGRWVSVMEGQYGKNAEKLQEFGIAPRMQRPHRGKRGKA